MSIGALTKSVGVKVERPVLGRRCGVR